MSAPASKKVDVKGGLWSMRTGVDRVEHTVCDHDEGICIDPIHVGIVSLSSRFLDIKAGNRGIVIRINTGADFFNSFF